MGSIDLFFFQVIAALALFVFFLDFITRERLSYVQKLTDSYSLATVICSEIIF